MTATTLLDQDAGSPPVEVDEQFAIVPLWLLDALRPYERRAGTAMLVYVSLGRWADYSTGECWPSHTSIAEASGVGVSSVKTALNTLRQVGAVDWVGDHRDDGSRRPNRYSVRRSNPRLTATPSLPTGYPPSRGGGYPPASLPARNETQKNEIQKNELLSHASFDDWYDRYPKKQGKAEARKRWGRMSDADRQAAMNGLCSVEAKAKAEGNKYVPMASTWLNQRRWEDADYAGPEAAADTRSGRSRGALARLVERHS